MATSSRVEFLTVDGVTLRGDLYMPKSTTKGAPILVMTQGVSIPPTNIFIAIAVLTFCS